MNILLLEPDPLTAQLVTRKFQAKTHVVEWHASAQEGIHSIDESQLDCIVLEPQLGLHNGIEFLYELRSYTDWLHIPVVIYSINRAVQQREFQPAFRQLNVKDVLYKATNTLDELYDVVVSYASQLA